MISLNRTGRQPTGLQELVIEANNRSFLITDIT